MIPMPSKSWPEKSLKKIFNSCLPPCLLVYLFTCVPVSFPPMRWIYLSPHFDDAVLSCGGLIHEQACQGLQTEIWTIFAGDPPPGPLSEFAQQTHVLWGITSGEDMVAMRRAEDITAAGIVDADL